jgi:hypothetical protein
MYAVHMYCVIMEVAFAPTYFNIRNIIILIWTVCKEVFKLYFPFLGLFMSLRS